MHTYGSNISTYQQTEVKTSNRLDLLVMLYDGAVKFMNQAIECQEKSDMAGKGAYVSKAMAIISEFKSTLSFAYDKDLATNLDRLYTFINDKLIKANITKDSNHIHEAVKITIILRDAWKQLQVQEQGKASSETNAPNQDNYFRISV